MDEVVLEYRRVMCDLMWRSLVQQQPGIFNFITWTEINDTQELKIPEMGKLCTEMENFTVFTKSILRLISILLRRFNQDLLQEIKKIFSEMVLYILPEVYQAMECIVVECINISNMNLFVSNYGKSMHLSEFKLQQQHETGTVIKYLKETWLEKIIQSVRLCLRDVGKGWFDIEQKNYDVSGVIKLKRFMDLISHRMQVT